MEYPTKQLDGAFRKTTLVDVFLIIQNLDVFQLVGEGGFKRIDKIFNEELECIIKY